MASTQNSTISASPGIPLPLDFLAVEQIQNLSNEAIKAGQKVNLLGFVKDFQPPVQTGGTDFKCTIEVVDPSVPPGSLGIKVNIFWPRDDMPFLDGAGDIALVRNAKVQMYRGGVSLLANFSSEIHILPASRIPTSLSGSSDASWRSHPPRKGKRPTASETAYAIGANGGVEELCLPSIMEFQDRSMQAMNLKDKFALLKDVKSDRFYDILGVVVQVYDEGSYERFTMHVSDYTANSAFYDHAREGKETSESRDDDDYKYIRPRPKTAKNWPGPHGKMSIQLTLYDGHATFAREQVKAGQWVLLRNVHIKYGKQGGRLEGFLRGDRNAFEGKVQVEVLKQSEEPDENDSRWKAAIGRKYQWERREKQDRLDETAGKKRKRDDEAPKANSKTRRKERRAAGEGKAAAVEMKVKDKFDLNENIRCSNPDQPAVMLAHILQPRKLLGGKDSDGNHLSPFDVCKYKANVRVVDFFPPKIEDFAVGRRLSEYDMLSDYSGGEDTDREEDMRVYRTGKGFPQKKWEWRFALQVVDAGNKASAERMWLVVGNHDAHMLLNLDAANLGQDADALRDVKEQLCVLWGDLEEQKSTLMRVKTLKAQNAALVEPLPNHKPGKQPPIDSDDEDENQHLKPKAQLKSVNASVLSECDSNIGGKRQSLVDAKQQSCPELQIKNKAFTCNIKQYMVKVKESDPTLANAGNGKRWERRFGLFGTQIQ